MTITTTWAIAQLEYKTADGFVFTAHWTVNASDGIHSADTYGSCSFSRPNNLIPYESLTEETVINWVKEALGEEKIAEIKKLLEFLIEEKKAPKTAKGVPWPESDPIFDEEAARLSDYWSKLLD